MTGVTVEDLYGMVRILPRTHAAFMMCDVL